MGKINEEPNHGLSILSVRVNETNERTGVGQALIALVAFLGVGVYAYEIHADQAFEEANYRRFKRHSMGRVDANWFEKVLDQELPSQSSPFEKPPVVRVLACEFSWLGVHTETIQLMVRSMPTGSK